MYKYYFTSKFDVAKWPFVGSTISSTCDGNQGVEKIDPWTTTQVKSKYASLSEEKKQERRAYQRDYYRRKNAQRESNKEAHTDAGIIIDHRNVAVLFFGLRLMKNVICVISTYRTWYLENRWCICHHQGNEVPGWCRYTNLFSSFYNATPIFVPRPQIV